ncbi:putative membrane protein YkoI [Ochrobactrum sp. 19YEA23]|uniref:PepSY domain-containing protein n=1 Tax=Ochrobactrum sp. 19YEA23 TaxID=3039854 RepID=UPI002478DCF2|nr:putative membrane protein YkoI [Ochrobactrum sp. 19YEA23]
MYRFSAIAAVIVAALLSTVPAQAQSIEIGPNGIQVNPDDDRRMHRDRRDYGDEISERRAARIARNEGMDEVESVSRRRNAYIVRGLDRDDNDMRVIIDRRSGDVLEVR